MRPIGDYAIIGDCRAAALVSRDGSIDWLAWPRFDSDAVFASILDDDAGFWSLRPKAPAVQERSYVAGTNVLQTLFTTETGSLRLTDLMPVSSEEAKRHRMLPDHQLLRRLECERGEVDVELVFRPRPGFGLGRVRLRDAGKLGLRVETRGGLFVLRSDRALPPPRDDEVRGTMRLRAGEQCHFSLTFDAEWIATLPPLGPSARDAISDSIAWWRHWAAAFRYDGPCRDAVLRSALVLKLLVYAPSGAIVAAPTTSLPERIGGDLNWDYRFCWLRDAALTVRSLFGLGFAGEACAFLSWLLHATRLTRPALRVLYDVYGNAPAPERALPHLRGYRSSRPVRIGNAASDQRQLDVYGEVLDAAAQFVHHGGTLDRETGRMLRAFGEYVCRHWAEPDEGIWEPRSGPRHHTHSRLLCWTALDRLLELEANGEVSGVPVPRFAQQRDLIRHEIEQRAWSPGLDSYVSQLDGSEVDATLLLLAWYGFERAGSRRMTSTYRRIREQLGARDDLLYRYRTAPGEAEGTFGICSFWGAEYLALDGGPVDEARRSFERLVAKSNDVGLFAEEIDPGGGEALGNFPQAFTHVGLINAALSLSHRLTRHEPPVRPGRPPKRELADTEVRL